ncbi:Nsp1-like C-terminal region-domain-containing protein [Russula compacta]|nr:Nsp1-like C-terminal region-domain-containing protein [Russula compacta]
MSSNFGTGSAFGAPSNQNRNQTTPTPGTAPAATGGLFGNLGANTTNSSVFGGAGMGNTPGGGGGTTSGTTGGFFGTGGSLFGSKNTNTTAPTPAAAGTSSPFNTALFGGTSGTTAGQGLFGNSTVTNAGAAGGSSFGFPKPAAPGSNILGSATGGPTGTSGSGTTGGNLFGGTTTATGGAGNPNAAGSPAPAATGTTASSNILSGGLFGNAKPADNVAKPATSNFFSAPTTTGTGSSMGTTATGPGTSLFSGFAPKPNEPSISSSAPQSALPGGSLFKPPGTSTTATTPAANAQPAFSLGGPAATGDRATSTTGTAGGGLFANLGATANKDGRPEEKKNGASAAPPTFSLGGQTTGTATAPASSATPSPITGTQALSTTTTSAISVPPPSMLKGKSIEEIINRWSTELETHVRDFNKFASEVAVWDRSLIENGNNLAALYNLVLAAEREQNDIDQSLDHIEQQEKELSATVEMYEKQMTDILGGQGGTLRTLDTGPADTERDKNYMLATELHNHLDDLSSSLAQLIESVNEMSIGQGDGKAASEDDPMVQIAQVLSNHLESLQWIDGASRDLEEKVVEVEKRIKDVGSVSQGGLVLGGGSRSRGFGLNR